MGRENGMGGDGGHRGRCDSTPPLCFRHPRRDRKTRPYFRLMHVPYVPLFFKVRKCKLMLPFCSVQGIFQQLEQLLEHLFDLLPAKRVMAEKCSPSSFHFPRLSSPPFPLFLSSPNRRHYWLHSPSFPFLFPPFFSAAPMRKRRSEEDGLTFFWI